MVKLTIKAWLTSVCNVKLYSVLRRNWVCRNIFKVGFQRRQLTSPEIGEFPDSDS